MNQKSLRFRVTDALLIALIVLPLLCGMALKVLLFPPANGIEISGAKIFFTISAPVQDLPITESQVNSWLVILSVLGVCLYLTHGITAKGGSRRQHLAEWLVEKSESLVKENMGDYFHAFAPFIAAIMALSAFSSLLTLIGALSSHFRYERCGRMGAFSVLPNHLL